MTLEARLLRLRKTNEEISQAMGDTSDKAVGHYYTGTTGIPLAKIESFLAAHGLRVVENGSVCCNYEEFKMVSLAAKRWASVLVTAAECCVDPTDITTAIRAFAEKAI